MLENIAKQFPMHHNPEDFTRTAIRVRQALIAGVGGAYASGVAETVAMAIGPDDGSNSDGCHVRLHYRTRNGKHLTLLGGWIHASEEITWDVCCDGREFENRQYNDWQYLTTKELVRRLRNL